MELIELHAIAKGRVQGVGFRNTVRKYAYQLGLVGTVKNLPDQSVEIYAQGSKESLKAFISLLKQESRGIKVESLSEDYRSIHYPFDDFSIIV